MANTDDISYRTTVAIVFAVSITCIALVLRFLAKKLNRIPYGADDHVMVLGALFTIANALIYLWTNKYGNGRHMDTIKPHDLTLYWRTLFVSYQLYGAAITAIKISILLFYRRVFSTAQFRKWIYSIGFLVVAWLLANNLVFAFQCTPVQKAWELELPGKCVNPLITVRAVQFFNVILDAVVLILPVSAVLRLQLSTAKKISVLAVFLFGGLSLVIAIVRLSILFTEHLNDITYETTICSWTVVEPAIEVVSGCLPTMAPLIKLWPRAKGLLSSIFGFTSFSQSRPIPLRDSKDDHYKYSYESKLHKLQPHDDSKMVSKVYASARLDQSEDSDVVPLQSIKVRQDIECIETKKNSNNSHG